MLRVAVCGGRRCGTAALITGTSTAGSRGAGRPCRLSPASTPRSRSGKSSPISSPCGTESRKPAALRVMRFWGASDRTARDSVLLAAALLLLVIARRPAGAVGSAAPTPPVLVAEPNSGPASVLAAVREATAQYLDVDRARADGF